MFFFQISDGYGPKVDVWSCGMCCVEMADGKPPFWDLSPIQVKKKKYDFFFVNLNLNISSCIL